MGNTLLQKKSDLRACQIKWAISLLLFPANMQVAARYWQVVVRYRLVTEYLLGYQNHGRLN